MRISDWSSDVCSSDLGDAAAEQRRLPADLVGGDAFRVEREEIVDVRIITPGPAHAVAVEIGRGDAAAARIEAAALEAFRIGRVEQVIGRGLEADRRARGEAAEHRAAAEIGERLDHRRSEEHTSELQSLMRISYAVFC